jgi:hypothetical protein
MANQTDVSTTALVVSLIALIIAIGQLAQQLFGTAEGYRRCQESIIGPWSRLRRRRFRFSELRIQTQFMTPNFFLLEDDDSRLPANGETSRVVSDTWYNWVQSTLSNLGRDLCPGDVVPLNASHSLIPELSTSYGAEQAGWLLLLSRLRNLEQVYNDFRLAGRIPMGISIKHSSERQNLRRSQPVFQPLPNSWDFMPPDVVRPLATTTLGNILIIAHRLGTEWRELRPGEGIMRAEGSGHSLASLELRGLGLALRYSYNDFQPEKIIEYTRTSADQSRQSADMWPLNNLFIPSRDADKMAFGLIPADRDLMTEEYNLGGGNGSMDHVSRILRKLGVRQETRQYLTTGPSRGRFDEDSRNDDVPTGFTDALYLLPPWLPLPDLGAVRIRLPYRQCSATPLNWREGIVTFWVRLRQFLETIASKPPQLVKVLSHLDRIRNEYPNNFIHIHSLKNELYHFNGDSMSSENALLMLKEMFDDTTTFFKYLQGKYLPLESRFEKFGTGFHYPDLVAAHIEMAVEAHHESRAKPLEQRRDCDELDNFRFLWMTEQAHLYVDKLGQVEDAMLRRNQYLARDDIRDAWWTMMLKGIVWKFSVQPHVPPGYAPIPSHFYGSEFPVYII